MRTNAATAVWVVTLLTGFIGYMLGKSMQEPRRMVRAWLIHLIANVSALSFSAMAAPAAQGY